MVDVFRVITEAYELYRENWKSIISAFAVLFVLSIIISGIDLVARILGNTICEAVDNAILIILFCIAPPLMQILFQIIDSLLSVVITMAVITPMGEIAAGKPISRWESHFTKQIVNAVLVILLRLLVLLVSFSPLIIVVILNISTLVALKDRQDITGLLLGGGFITIVLTLLLGVAVSMILNYLLLFLEMEVVLGGSSIIDAAMKSARLVLSNLADTLVYSAIWFAIGFGVGIVTFILACTICLIPLAIAVGALAVEPINLLSRVILWRTFKNLGK